jgi:hypothetical protein
MYVPGSRAGAPDCECVTFKKRTARTPYTCTVRKHATDDGLMAAAMVDGWS